MQAACVSAARIWVSAIAEERLHLAMQMRNTHFKSTLSVSLRTAGEAKIPSAEHKHCNIVICCIGFKESQRICLFPGDLPAERRVLFHKIALSLPECKGTTCLDFSLSNLQQATDSAHHGLMALGLLP
jgi:hypothetical protein